MNIYHVVNFYEAKNPDDKKRNNFAEASWSQLYDHGVTPIFITDAMMTRSSLELGDIRPVPYVKDIIEKAIWDIGISYKREVHDDDVIIFTNMDTILHPDLLKIVAEKKLFYGCRRELEEDRDKHLSTEEIDQLALAHPSSADVFVFTVGWWKTNKAKYPDMLLGCQWWDTTMIDLMESSKTEDNIRITNYIYHRNHKPFWFSKETMFKNPGQQHNRTLARNWSNPNPSTKFADVIAWERKLENQFNSNLGKHRVVVGKTTYVF